MTVVGQIDEIEDEMEVMMSKIPIKSTKMNECWQSHWKQIDVQDWVVK